MGTGLVCMQKVADLQKAGVGVSIFLADYHSWINRKLGGDLELIRDVAVGYFKEALKRSLLCVGGDPERLRVVTGYELYERLGITYLEDVLRVSKHLRLSRAMRSITIAGRRAGESLELAQLLYVPMQVADIFALGVNLVHSGMDQRKAHVIAMDMGDAFGYKPIALHHHLLTGLHITEAQRNALMLARTSRDREKAEDQLLDIKMSKSKPHSAIFVHDTPEEIAAKISGAYCPKAETALNPVVEIVEFVICPLLAKEKKEIEIRNGKTGLAAAYGSIDALKESYQKGEIHPADIKNYAIEQLTAILEPARKYFAGKAGARYMEQMEGIRITR